MAENLPLDVIIELTDCSIWQQDHLVLSNVNLKISNGEFLYLVGKVGSGKTSLIKMLNGQLPLKSGSGIIAGYNLSKLKEKEIPYLRRKIGIVFQDFQLLTDRTVYDNLEFVLKATGWKDKTEINSRIGDVLEKVGLGLQGYKMPHQLSGGEQQRVVIGRALLNDNSFSIGTLLSLVKPDSKYCSVFFPVPETKIKTMISKDLLYQGQSYPLSSMFC